MLRIVKSSAGVAKSVPLRLGHAHEGGQLTASVLKQCRVTTKHPNPKTSTSGTTYKPPTNLLQKPFNTLENHNPPLRPAKANRYPKP